MDYLNQKPALLLQNLLFISNIDLLQKIFENNLHYNQIIFNDTTKICINNTLGK